MSRPSAGSGEVDVQPRSAVRTKPAERKAGSDQPRTAGKRSSADGEPVEKLKKAYVERSAKAPESPEAS